MVSIYENTPFRQLLSFLTAGNKSKCGTLHRLTHPRQLTVEPILRPVSSQNRQVSQRKPFVLSPVPTQTSSRLRIHGTSVPSRPEKLPGTLIHTHSHTHSHSPDAPPMRPQPHPSLHTRTPPTPKSHVIPPGPHSSTARKPRNINDLISKPETPSGELRAKLLSTCHGSTSRRPPRSLDTHTRTTGAAGVEGAGGTGGHGRASRRGAERSEVA